MLGNYSYSFSLSLLKLCSCFEDQFSKKKIQEYHQSVEKFESRSGMTQCRACSGSKLIAKVISRQQKLSLAGKEIIMHVVYFIPG